MIIHIVISDGLLSQRVEVGRGVLVPCPRRDGKRDERMED